MTTREVCSNWKSIPWNAVFAGKIVADRIFLRSALIRKDLLPYFAGDYMPRTLVDGVLANPNGYSYSCGFVSKPRDSSNAYGVVFNEDGPIVQHVIDSQLYGNKFHIRSLLVIVGDLDGYVYDDSRVLVAPAPEIRITNRSFNKYHPDYDERKHNLSLNETTLDVSRQIRDIAAGICAALAKHGDDARQRRCKRRFLALPNTWEMFGLDFMLDVNGNLVLLEANPEPSMDMWPVSRKDMFRGECPVTSKLPRSDDHHLGFTQVYSKRLATLLAAAARRPKSCGETGVSL